MKYRYFAVLLVLVFVCGLVGCVGGISNSVPGTTAPGSVPPSTAQGLPSTPAATVPDTPPAVLDPDFSDMPDMYSDLAQVFLTGDTAVFAFFVAGMDAASTTLVTYDLKNDLTLGQLDLGEDTVSIFPLEDGRFAVLSHSRRTFRVFDADCDLLSETALTGIAGEIGFAGLQGHMLLLSEQSGKLVLYSLEDASWVSADLEPGVYSYVGAYDGHFLVESYAQGLISISLNGQTELLFRNGSAQVVGAAYAAGVRGDYITMLPLLGGDAFMAPAQLDGEIFAAADGVGLLSHSQSMDGTFHYYATDAMTVTAVPVGGQVVAAALRDGCAVAVIRADGSQPLEYLWLDFSDHESVPIGKDVYDSGTVNGAADLPEPSGGDETVALLRRLEQTYGVRVLYQPDVFDLEPLGYRLLPAEEAAAYEKALLLEQLLEFLPEGLLKEMAQDRPIAVYLCQELYPTAGGMHTFLDGWNVLFLTVTGSDDYFLSVAAHEMAHALELGMEASVISAWRALMPEDVQEAYQDLSLTVEYTADDRGRTPVWFLDAYSRTSEMEDRAVTFAALFDAWRDNDYSRFQYDGLKQKANCWAELLRRTYESCRGAAFPWEAHL